MTRSRHLDLRALERPRGVSGAVLLAGIMALNVACVVLALLAA